MNFDMSDLDITNIGSWPLVIKIALVALVCVLVIAGWFYVDTQVQLDELAAVEKQEAVLRADFEKKQSKAANLEQYIEQIEEMKVSFGEMLRQLPDKTEVANLLVDVSQRGLGAGLEFELFDPVAEVKKEFYSELPINLIVRGDYHELGDFVSGLAALPRIVTIHNIQISKNGSSGEELSMRAVAKTYRYLEEVNE